MDELDSDLEAEESDSDDLGEEESDSDLEEEEPVSDLEEEDCFETKKIIRPKIPANNINIIMFLYLRLLFGVLDPLGISDPPPPFDCIFDDELL